MASNNNRSCPKSETKLRGTVTLAVPIGGDRLMARRIQRHAGYSDRLGSGSQPAMDRQPAEMLFPHAIQVFSATQEEPACGDCRRSTEGLVELVDREDLELRALSDDIAFTVFGLNVDPAVGSHG
jgi:hypothetical protein